MTATPPRPRNAVTLLTPLIGIRGRFQGRTLELVEVLADGPQVALLDLSSTPGIQANQYGDPLSRQPRTLTIPVVSPIDDDIHPALRELLPEAILLQLRSLNDARGLAGD
ncbi:ATPase [Thioalkalivibrio nitratireducens DSM 14787]|uniref:ATPase n=1 Tax=Thioalkalivibrio nitratireducens (strain DSM 14787 / UNIQEM 213 / ALEN2) TaxID=1255043 RepID=L0DVK7_THIND|nr:hypothetical protein [Thioalkalivibrio nitratireducens]AGA33639.1 ATPase [Thioalkalivibrio nitratireducens DSM 14787]